MNNYEFSLKNPPKVNTIISKFDFCHPMNHEDFRKYGHEMIEFIANFYENDIEKYPVQSQVKFGYLSELIPHYPPEKGESFENVMKDITRLIMPGITHWQHPNFYAYFPANSSYPSILGDMCSSMFNVIGFSWICSPACTELETIVLDWLGEAIRLPSIFLSHGYGGGVIQASASDAVVCMLFAAREHFIEKGISREKLIVYLSEETHSSLMKGTRIVGFQESQVRVLVCGSDESLNGEILRKQIVSDIEKGLTPCFCCATIGTTNTASVDDVKSIGVVCKEFGIYLHVDGAYLMAACLCPEYRHWLDGCENATSICWNPHKWMLTNFDCSLLYVRDRRLLTHAMEIDPEYLKTNINDKGSHRNVKELPDNVKEVDDDDYGVVKEYRNWEIPLGSRFRSLKLWFLLRVYGLESIRKYIRHHIALAEEAERMLKEDGRFEIPFERKGGLVCFKLNGHGKDMNKKLLDNLNSSGVVMMTGSEVKGIYFIRMAIGGTWTQHRHVCQAIDAIKNITDKLLSMKNCEN